MKLLAFDTCLDKTYIVLREDNKILTSKILESDEKNYHSAYLISTIAKTLKENNMKPSDLEGIAINVGPGSFTGIRACTTVARVMAQELDIKAVGIPSLEILSKAKEDEYVVALDARKNKAYLYDGELLGAIELEEVDKRVKGRNIITDDRLFERFQAIGNNVISYQKAGFDLGKILSDIAIERIKTEECDWRKLLPLYIQPPPVTMKK